MSTPKDIERLVLSSEGRAKLASAAQRLAASPPGGARPTGPVRYSPRHDRVLREPNPAELQYATDRSGVPLGAPNTGAESALPAHDSSALSLWAQAFEHGQFGGRSAFLNLPREAVIRSYLPAPAAWLIASGVHDRVSSLRLTAGSQELHASLFLFSDPAYRGGYMMFSVDQDSTMEVADLGPLGFNDTTSSMVLIRGFRKQLPALGIGSIIRPRLVQMVKAQDRVRLRGYPIVTWDPWPSFAPTLEFVNIRLPLTVVINNWFDYEAELRFWCYFFVTEDEHVHVTIYYYELWVSDGILADSIRDELRPLLDQAAVELTQALSSLVDALATLDIERIVLRPGQPYAFGGNVDDDVGVILVVRR